MPRPELERHPTVYPSGWSRHQDPGWPPPPVAEGLSLADVEPGDVAEVTAIFFDIVRNRCWEIGIRPGEVLECLEADGESGALLLRRRDGEPVVLSEACARFVLVSPATVSVGRAGRSA